MCPLPLLDQVGEHLRVQLAGAHGDRVAGRPELHPSRPLVPSACRSRWTCTCSVLPAVEGARSPHSAWISRSALTVVFVRHNSIASRIRGFAQHRRERNSSIRDGQRA
jgi:hypothetical protein